MPKIKEKFLKDYKKCAFDIDEVELEFFIYDDYVDVLNVMLITKTDKNISTLALDISELELLDIYLNDLKIDEPRYKIDQEQLFVYNVPERFSITIKNRIYPSKNTQLEGLYVSGDILCTQCEPEGFRKITPFIDRPDIMAKYKTTIVADKDKYPVLLSNGNLISKEIIGNKLEVTWEDPFAKPSYLFALVAGDLGSISDSFVTKSGKKVELNIYTDKGNESKCFYAMQSLKKAMKWDEDVYDREYDLDIYNIVAVDSFNMGAMENKGLNIFNSAYVLADKESATDRDFMGIESVIAHEYFHNWTGNRITCRDWFQLTLKEGLTVFRDQCFSADMNSKDVQRIEDVKSLKERQFAEDASAMAHPIQPKSYISMNNFYTATVYEKGAEVIRMIYTLLGKDIFKKGMDIYFERFDAKAVTVDDFIDCMQEASGIDFSQFKRWYDQSGTPVLEVDEKFKDGIFSITLTQHIPDTPQGEKQLPMFYPFKIALLNAKDGSLIEEKMLTVAKANQEIILGEFEEKPVLSLNRDFSAPIIVKTNERNNAFLARYDSNGYTKYEAMENFALKYIDDFIQNKTSDEKFIKTYGILLDEEMELSYKALLLELPSLSNILLGKNDIDINLYAEALDTLKYTIAHQYKEKFLNIYAKYHQLDNQSLDAVSIGKRAVKNLALSMLGELKDEAIMQMAKEQYYNSLNMGDKLNSLKVIDSINHFESEEEFRDFYNRYKDNQLLMVKYFSIKASLDDEFVLQRIIELEKDKLFDKKVPNLVRALYATFARNLKQFHNLNAKGYEFIAQKILTLDTINPQMAASLANSFKLYPKLQKKYQNLMQKEMEKILKNDAISDNTYEILSKINYTEKLKN